MSSSSSSAAAASNSEQAPRVRRVGAGIGYVVHALIFELDDDIRIGTCLQNATFEEMDITDDAVLKKRMVEWHELEPDESIFAVSGIGSSRSYLAHTVRLHINKNGEGPLRKLEFVGMKPGWSSNQPFRRVAPPGKYVVNAEFEDGTLVAIKTKSGRRSTSTRSLNETQVKVRPKGSIGVAAARMVAIRTFVHSYIRTFVHSYIHTYVHTYIC